MVRQVNIPTRGGWHLVHQHVRRLTWDDSGRLQESPSPAQPDHDEASTAWKPFTDIVVEGHIYSQGGPRQSVIASLEIGNVTRRIRATGDRQILRTAGICCEWSPPVPFERLPLTAARAYGGFDERASLAARELAELPEELAGIEPEMVSAFAYPRNRAGRGFLMADGGSVNIGRAVPNLDDPEDPVEEDRLLRHGPDDWVDAPVPAHWGWVDMHTFPRTLLLGERIALGRTTRRVREVELGALALADLEAPPRERWDLHNYLPLALLADPRGLLAAAPGMATQRILGGEPIRLLHMEPDVAERTLELPTTPPTIRIRPPGCSWFDTPAEIDTLVLQPDTRRLSLFYRGALRVAGRYPEEELALVEAEASVRTISP